MRRSFVALTAAATLLAHGGLRGFVRGTSHRAKAPRTSRSASSRSSTWPRCTSASRRASSAPAARPQRGPGERPGRRGHRPLGVTGQYQFGFTNITSLLIARPRA